MEHLENINNLLTGFSPDVRRRAAIDLIDSEDYSEDVLQALIKGLYDSDNGVKDICSRALSAPPEQIREKVASFVAPLIVNKDIEIRNLASDILMKLGTYSDKALIPFLENEDYLARQFACDILGNSGSIGIIDYIIKLTNDKNDNVRNSAYEAIGKMDARFEDKERSYLEFLIDKYENESFDLKPTIIESIGKIGGRIAQEFLLKKLKEEEDYFLQTTCIDALALGGQDISICDNLMKQMPFASAELQVVILKTIFAISFRLDKTINLPDDLRFVAQKALMDDDDDIRAAGLIALGEVYVEEDVDGLVNETLLNNTETQQIILFNLLCNSNFTTIEKFFNLYSASVQTDHSEIDFLSYLQAIWNEIDFKKGEFIIDTIIKLVFTTRFGVVSEIVDMLLNLNRELVIEKLKINLFSDNIEYLPEILDIIQKLNINEIFEDLKLLKDNYPQYKERINEIIK